MLRNLFIKNYALIQELDIQVDEQLTTITGETGAGKSILLGAIGLVMGQRADNSAIADQTEKCIIEATFDISSQNLKDLFETLEFDYQDLTIIRREILPNGKSRSFVNDTPANLANLKLISNHLIEVHTQNTGLLVTDPAEQIKLVDGYGQFSELFKDYSKAFKKQLKLSKELDELIEEQRQFIKEKEFIQFQFDELSELNLQPSEEKLLEDKINLLTQSSSIIQALQLTQNLISNNESNIIDQLNFIKNALRPVSAVSTDIKGLYERLESNIIELKDLGQEAEDLSDKIDQNPAELETLNERLAKIQNLLRKHQVNTCSELIELSHLFENKLLESQNTDEVIEKIQKELLTAQKVTIELGRELSKKRKESAIEIAKEAKQILQQLAIPNAQIEFQLDSNEQFLGPLGMDKINILFSANLGKSPQVLSQVASGGEISRLNFTFRSLIAKNKHLPTLIYDEADTGISGEVASKMGSMMSQLSKFHQVISITHLPQVAAAGQFQWLVYKSNDNHKTSTKVKKLSTQERVTVLAQMLSGTNPSESALSNAKELLAMNHNL